MENEKVFVMQIKESDILKNIQSEYNEDMKNIILERIKNNLNDDIYFEKMRFIRGIINLVELDIRDEISKMRGEQ